MDERPARTSPAAGPIGTVVVLGACIAAARYLHGLAAAPWARIELADPHTWLAATPAEDVVAALLRVAALATCWWLAGSVAVAVAVRLVGWRPAVALTDRVTPRLVRRLADRVTGGALVLASLIGPAAPAVGTPVVPAAEAEAGSFAPPGVFPDVTAGGPAAPGRHADGGAQARGVEARPPGGTVDVRAGDHLWGIARAELARRRGLPVDALDAGAVAGYWRRLVAANRHRLRSGDPDLVFPGETIVLPDHSSSNGSP